MAEKEKNSPASKTHKLPILRRDDVRSRLPLVQQWIAANPIDKERA